jgi:hypothetical protein
MSCWQTYRDRATLLACCRLQGLPPMRSINDWCEPREERLQMHRDEWGSGSHPRSRYLRHSDALENRFDVLPVVHLVHQPTYLRSRATDSIGGTAWCSL